MATRACRGSTATNRKIQGSEGDKGLLEEASLLRIYTNKKTDRQERVMRQTISGLVAAIAVVAASVAPAMACGETPCGQSYIPAPVYSGCNTGCGGWGYERLPAPHSIVIRNITASVTDICRITACVTAAACPITLATAIASTRRAAITDRHI